MKNLENTIDDLVVGSSSVTQGLEKIYQMVNELNVENDEVSKTERNQVAAFLLGMRELSKKNDSILEKLSKESAHYGD